MPRPLRRSRFSGSVGCNAQEIQTVAGRNAPPSAALLVARIPRTRRRANRTGAVSCAVFFRELLARAGLAPKCSTTSRAEENFIPNNSTQTTRCRAGILTLSPPIGLIPTAPAAACLIPPRPGRSQRRSFTTRTQPLLPPFLEQPDVPSRLPVLSRPRIPVSHPA